MDPSPVAAWMRGRAMERKARRLTDKVTNQGASLYHAKLLFRDLRVSGFTKFILPNIAHAHTVVQS